MGIETGLMAASALGGLYSSYKQGKQQKSNQKVAEQQYKDNSGVINDARTGLNNPSGAETGLEAFLNSLRGGAGTNGSGGAFIPGVDVPGIEGSTAYNSSQDALMQMVNRSAADQLGNAGTQLNDLATNGGRQDVSKLLASLGIQQNFATDEQAARLNASTSGLGQLAGTAGRIGEARLRAASQRDNNVINAGVQNTAMENAQNRRLAAAGQLGQLNLGAGQLNLGAAQGLTGLAGLLSSNQLGRGQLDLGRGQLDLGRSQLGQSINQQMLSGYGMLGQLQQGRQNQSTDLLKMMLMNQAPQRAADGSLLGGNISNTANSLLLLRKLGAKKR